MARIKLSGRIQFNFDNLHFDDPLTFGPYRIMQFGDLSADYAFACPQHVQRVHEISYVVSGKAIFVCDNKNFITEKDSVIVCPKGILHEILPLDNEPLRYYYLGIEIADRTDPVERAMEDFLQGCDRYVARADRAVVSAFQDIFYNMLNQDDFSNQLIVGAVRKLLVWTKRSFDGIGSRVQLPVAYEEKHRILSELCSTMDESVEDKDALKQLPAKFGYSYSYLSGLFSKAMGMSLRAYFNMRRYEYACSLLEEGGSVTEVAEKMGYSSVHSFSHAFADRSGFAPSHYMEKRGAKKKQSAV